MNSFFMGLFLIFKFIVFTISSTLLLKPPQQVRRPQGHRAPCIGTLFRGLMKVPKEAWGGLLNAASQDSQEEQLVDILPGLMAHWDKMARQAFSVCLAINLPFQTHSSLRCAYSPFTNAEQRPGMVLLPSNVSGMNEPTSQASEVRGLRRLQRGPQAAGGCCGASPQRLSGSPPAPGAPQTPALLGPRVTPRGCRPSPFAPGALRPCETSGRKGQVSEKRGR